jgi:GT2 family glycosyltransferase
MLTASIPSIGGVALSSPNSKSTIHLSDNLTLSIVSHGHGKLVEKLVRQLDEIRELRGARVIVTLNQPGEFVAFEKEAPRYLKMTIIRNSLPLGFGANHNQAFQCCATPWFAILNPDLSIFTDIFTPLIATACEREVALVAPLVVRSDGKKEDSVRWNLTPWSLLKRKIGVAGESDLDDGHFRWFAGMFYLVSSRVYRQMGGFDTRYFLYCEDYDLCARMYLAGHHSFFVNDIRVVHDARRATWNSRKHLFMHLSSIWKVWFSMPVWQIAVRGLLRKLGV